MPHDDHAGPMHDLAAPAVAHFRAAPDYGDADIRKGGAAGPERGREFVHAQTVTRCREAAGGGKVTATRGRADSEGGAATGSAGTALDSRFAGGQGRDRPVGLRRLRAVPVPPAEVPVGLGSQGGVGPGPRRHAAVPPGVGAVPD